VGKEWVPKWNLGNTYYAKAGNFVLDTDALITVAQIGFYDSKWKSGI
jgi:hypothetical protein